MNKECDSCKEKDKTINRLLRSFRKDKKIYRITIAILFLLNILTAAFGREGITMFIDLIKGFIK